MNSISFMLISVFSIYTAAEIFRVHVAVGSEEEVETLPVLKQVERVISSQPDPEPSEPGPPITTTEFSSTTNLGFLQCLAEETTTETEPAEEAQSTQDAAIQTHISATNDSHKELTSPSLEEFIALEQMESSEALQLLPEKKSSLEEFIAMETSLNKEKDELNDSADSEDMNTEDIVSDTPSSTLLPTISEEVIKAGLMDDVQSCDRPLVQCETPIRCDENFASYKEEKIEKEASEVPPAEEDPTYVDRINRHDAFALHLLVLTMNKMHRKRTSPQSAYPMEIPLREQVLLRRTAENIVLILCPSFKE